LSKDRLAPKYCTRYNIANLQYFPRHFQIIRMARAKVGYGSPKGAVGSAKGGLPGGSKIRDTTCLLCHYWFPSDLMPRVGECDNPSSRYYQKLAFSDKQTEDCFVARSLEGLEFMWCQNHRQTIYFTELPDHGACSVFVKSASLPVEDQAELTLAG